jgi:Mrp family chromosome partitioning ATPase
MSGSQNSAPRQVPANFGPLRGANANARITGPCGDTMEFWLSIRNGMIERATFTTDGCHYSLRCGNHAANLAQGKPLDDAEQLQPEQVLSHAGHVPEDSRHCALLAVNTLRKAIEDYREHASERPAAPSVSGQPIQFRNPTSEKKREEEEAIPGFEDILNGNPQNRIRHKIVVLSGKGGVGKSTVATNLAMALAMEGLNVGLLDVDIHGPSVPGMLGLQQARVMQTGQKLTPVDLGALKVMSIGFLLGHPDDPVIWRGPVKMGLIQQFLEDVEWGDLDYLVVDCPPGTGDEPLSICQLLDDPDGAVIVTTPQEVAEANVRKSVNFCFRLDLPVLGIVENMSGFVCPDCGKEIDMFPTGAGERLARDFGIPLLGRIPMEPIVGISTDEGTPFIRRFPNSVTAKAFLKIAAPLLDRATASDSQEHGG